MGSGTVKPYTPRNMGAVGLTFWKKVTKDYEFRHDELRILEDACRTMSLIAKLEAGVAKTDLYMMGSQGQQVINPGISELRQQRNTLRSLLAALDLPEESGEHVSRSVKARDAAKSRWTVAYGKAS